MPRAVYWLFRVTVHTPLSREVFWYEYAKIPRHTSQNSIAAGNLEDVYKRQVFEHAGGSISFYPDKNGAAPTAELYHRETRSISVHGSGAFIGGPL